MARTFFWFVFIPVINPGMEDKLILRLPGARVVTCRGTGTHPGLCDPPQIEFTLLQWLSCITITNPHSNDL